MRNDSGFDTDVLIAGAGPSGLMMACQLAASNIDFRIIDKKESPPFYSGAMIIHSKSLEIFHQLGIAEELIEKGIIVRAISVFINGKKTIKFDVKNLGRNISAFPYMLLIEQAKTENLLADHIKNKGHDIHRKTEIINFVQDESGVTSVIRHAGGHEDRIRSRYLIASDGGQSTVRSVLTVPFIGKTHKRSLFIIDCKSDIDVPHNEICFAFSRIGIAGFFPIIDGRWRIDGTLYSYNDKDEITFTDIKENFGKKFEVNARIYEPDWFSVFHSHQRYSAVFSKNYCFMIGDAAHLYSPVGGQGMNTGFQDAHNLGWKLALVINRLANNSILKTYETERKPIAKKVSKNIDFIFRFISTKKPFLRRMRGFILPGLLRLFVFLLKNEKFRDSVFLTISQTGISYNNNFLPGYKPADGKRLPYIPFEENGKEMNTHEIIHLKGFHLLVFLKKQNDEELVKSLQKYGNALTLRLIHYTLGTRELFKKLKIKKSGFYLIKPDMHIACKGKLKKIRPVEKYLNKYLTGFDNE